MNQKLVIKTSSGLLSKPSCVGNDTITYNNCTSNSKFLTYSTSILYAQINHSIGRWIHFLRQLLIFRTQYIYELLSWLPLSSIYIHIN